MPKPRRIGKTGGRQKGTPNKATACVKAIAGQYTQTAIGVLVGIMSDPEAPHAARVAAAAQLLDRGHGRPHQSIDMKAQNEHRLVARVPEPMDRAEWEEFLKYKRNEKPLETAPLKFAPLLAGSEFDAFKRSQQAKLIEAKAKPINGKSTPQPN